MHLSKMDFHGFNDIRDSKSTCSKCFWICLLLAATAVTIYISALTLIRYLNNPYSTTVNQIPLSTIALPDVQICTHKILNFTKMRTHGFCNQSIAFLHSYLTLYYTFHYSAINIFKKLPEMTRDVIPIEEIIRKESNTSTLDFEALILNYGLDCSEVLHECSIGWAQFNCCQYARPLAHPNFGKCFVLENLKSVSNQTWAGPSAGLVMMITPEPQSAGKAVLSLNGNLPVGANIDVGKQFRVASISVTGLLYNKANYISLSQTQYNRQTSSCAAFTSRECMLYCFSKSFQQMYNCSQMGFFSLSSQNTPVCLPHQVFDAISIANYATLNKLYTDCTDSICQKPACVEYTYQPSISYADVDVELMQQANNINDSNASQVYIFYGVLGYLSMEQFQTLTVDGLLAAIGGNLGLYMGASLITVVQAVLLVFHVCKGICHRRNKRKIEVQSCVSTFVRPAICYSNQTGCHLQTSDKSTGGPGNQLNIY